VNTRLLLCTDLDRTVLPNGTQPESPQARSHFGMLVNRAEVTLVYVTGRDQQLVKEAISDYQLPQPDYVISDVGTSIYQVHDDSWRNWQDWQQEIAPDWGKLGHDDICKLLRDIVDLQPQDAARQNDYKSSFYYPLHSDTGELSRLIHSQLETCHVKANLIWSIDEPRSVGLLDILPLRASKKHAVFFLMEHKGFTLGETVFAGDSGNDLPVLVSEIPAVLVANASMAVRDQAQAEAAAQGNSDRLYLANGNLMGMNGNYTAGILEGLVHFRPEIRNWLSDCSDAEQIHG